MKILMLLYNRTGHGTYWRAIGFARELVRLGHAVTLLAISPEKRTGYKEFEEEGVKFLETPDLLSGKLRSGWDPYDIFARIGWLRKRAFDLIHGFETRPVVLYPALYLKKRLGVPLILDWADWFGRGGSVEERTNPLEKALLRPVETFLEENQRKHADRVTVICTLLAQKSLDMGFAQKDVLLLRNGTDIEAIKPASRQAARTQLGLPQGMPLLAYTGAIFRQDAQLLRESFGFLLKELPEARILLIGYTPSSLGLPAGQVIRTGPVDRQTLAACLAACDVGILPLQDSGANRGRFPMKFNDFLAAGRCIAATDVGDVGMIMKQEPVGFLAPPRAEELAQAALQALTDRAAREQREGHARYLAETRYAWPIVTAPLNKFYLERGSGA